ncbi:MAG: outer membrane protein transport protein [Prevotellaceae bacterium]|jgi:long-subunit fatty acid transport protein|nr:outer membrane protein transport protein [Prevotellaceae bacterium]
MKKIIASIAVLLACGQAMAQGEMDALKYSQSDIRGTARYTSMAGAMGALGGDASAIMDNPAALGIYRSSDISLTPGIAWVNTNNGSNKDFSLGATFDNFSAIFNFMTGKNSGAVAHNFGITYNRLRNFRSNISASRNGSTSSLTDYMAYRADESYDALGDMGWYSNLLYKIVDDQDNVVGYESILNEGEKVNKRYYSEERGTIDEWDFSYSINLNNILYLGATIGVQAIDYELSSTHTEDFAEGGGFDLYNTLETTGTGLNFRIGGIVRPVDFLRIGAAFTTPSVYKLTDYYYDRINSSEAEPFSHGHGAIDYTLTTPYKVMGSLGFVIGKQALVGINYEMKDYSTAKYSGTEYSVDNEFIKQDFTMSHTIKIGAEYKFDDALSLRAGYALTTSPVKSSVEDEQLEISPAGSIPAYSIPQNYSQYSAGFGYRSGNFYLDVAYALSQKKDHLYLYPYTAMNTTEAIKVKTTTNTIVATLGLKF